MKLEREVLGLFSERASASLIEIEKAAKGRRSG